VSPSSFTASPHHVDRYRTVNLPVGISVEVPKLIARPEHGGLSFAHVEPSPPITPDTTSNPAKGDRQPV
ncbi:MAG TPA: hypothetical protein VJQ82_27740, partial [Terriglobales bacterium]|nr:hypothetical protein [Terriglobales bacterium]